MKQFSDWKFKTEDLARQQRYKRFLMGQISVTSEEEPETMWVNVEEKTEPVNQK